MLSSRIRAAAAFAVAASLTVAGCQPGSLDHADGGGDGGCPASQRSGLYLLHFGPIAQDVLLGGTAKVTVVVTRGSATEGEGRPEPGQKVAFKLTSPASGVKLDHSQAVTDKDGIASVELSVSSTADPALYQVEASLPGACRLTFTVDAARPLRQLRAVTPSPYDTFTNSRVPIAVEASTNGNAKLAGEEITFRLALGKTSATKLSAVGGSASGGTLKVKTNAAGRATVMLTTGAKAISQLEVVASMKGTADARVRVRIAEGSSKGCKTDSDCPLSYSCKSSLCVAPPPSPSGSGGCKTDADCQKPTKCQTATGQCVEPEGVPCDPFGVGDCKSNEQCIGGVCTTVPTSCKNNSQCPATFACVSGKCQPQGKPPSGGCTSSSSCSSGQACVNGQCKAKTTCTVSHKTDRLKGSWRYDQQLNLRQALGLFTKGLLSVAGKLRDVIEGKLSIKGVPGFITKLIQKYLKKLISKYIPPWGQQLIVALGNINDVLGQMRVVSTVRKTSVGRDRYVSSEQWTLVEFTYKGKKVSSPPSAIPEIGKVKVNNYTATEVCGELFIQKHRVGNVVGGIFKWAINATLSLVTCNSSSVSCYNSVDQALQQTINCTQLALQIDSLVRSVWYSAPPVYSLLSVGCEALKKKAISALKKEIDGVKTKLSLLELSGTAKVTSASALDSGKWNGVLGSGLLKGNFSGTFKATKTP